MTLEELKRKVSIRKTGYGHWEVTIEYRGKSYSCTTTNSMAVDDTSRDEWERLNVRYDVRTCKKGYQDLYNECKRANDLI